MTIYTRRGDQGETDLPGGARAPKDAAVLKVCGDLDELNALLGMARCEPLPEGMLALLEQIQRHLFNVGAELAAGGTDRSPAHAVAPEHVAAIEQVIDRYEAKMPSVGTFILPAGSRAAAVLHLARAVCRRAERRLVALARRQPPAVQSQMLCYLNRLGDLLFVLARAANSHVGISDTPC